MSLKRKTVIIGDTRYFHIGSLVNCNYLVNVIQNKYEFLGLFGGEEFFFRSFKHLCHSITHYTTLYKNVKKADIIFFNGEGVIEPNSIYGDTIFYLARYIRSKWPRKESRLVNFSCFEEEYGNWSLFHKIIPRDKWTYDRLKPYHNNIELGFDCSILQQKILSSANETKQDIVIFRGRRDIPNEYIYYLKQNFTDKKIIKSSAFWKFDQLDQIPSLKKLQDLLQQTFLVVSSSFHGIVFSTRFGIPFIPIDTIGTDKNASVAADILEIQNIRKNIDEWIHFYTKEETYRNTQQHLVKRLPELQHRATINAGKDKED